MGPLWTITCRLFLNATIKKNKISWKEIRVSQHKPAPILYFFNLFYILLQEIKPKLSAPTCACEQSGGAARRETDLL